MNVITVKLPRECSGQEVLDAFRAAASFQETPTCKWEAHGYTPSTGVATSENTFSQARGYYATPAYLHEQGHISRLFRGHRDPTWSTVSGDDLSRFETQIRLHALQSEKEYVKVEMTLTHLVPEGSLLGYANVIHNPDAKEFALFRPAYDRIVREFLRRLTRS